MKDQPHLALGTKAGAQNASIISCVSWMCLLLSCLETVGQGLTQQHLLWAGCYSASSPLSETHCSKLQCVLHKIAFKFLTRVFCWQLCEESHKMCIQGCTYTSPYGDVAVAPWFSTFFWSALLQRHSWRSCVDPRHRATCRHTPRHALILLFSLCGSVSFSSNL